ncbi:MAG TPA: HAMP domain-containing sensor histidine kinase [Mycobacteriales bacterium]|nr:HAMP domain-containing sensor histidine kinase [Mycobacteriales bacterium]
MTRARRFDGRLAGASAAVPLRVKLVAALVGLVALALAGTGTAAIAALRSHEMTRVDTELTRVAEATGGYGPHGGAGGPGGRAADITRAGRSGDHFVGIVGPGGVVRDLSAENRSEQTTPQLPPLADLAPYRRSSEAFTVPSVQSGGPQWRVRVAPGRPGGQTFVVASSLRGVESTLRELARLQTGIGLAALLLLGAVGYVVVRTSLRPLVEVESTAEAIAAGDLTRRVPVSHPRTEVGRLSAAFNGMLAQIEAAFRSRAQSEAAARESEQRMRRFVADASHELRTPLTSIRGFAELYRQGAVRDADATARLMRRIEDEAARMGLLVDDLLLLARLDQQRPLERQRVDLLAVATDAVHDARVVAPERRIDLRLAPGLTAPVVVGDEARLRQVVGNLVTNALTHTPEDAAVTVALATEEAHGAGRVVLEVRDRGPGLAPGDAERVFERFYRADSSRTRSSGGSGLGLSIVAALIAAHGGTVGVTSRVGSGTTFRVVLPAGDA